MPLSAASNTQAASAQKAQAAHRHLNNIDC